MQWLLASPDEIDGNVGVLIRTIYVGLSGSTSGRDCAAGWLEESTSSRLRFGSYIVVP
jgi:hypothetical protein